MDFKVKLGFLNKCQEYLASYLANSSDEDDEDEDEDEDEDGQMGTIVQPTFKLFSSYKRVNTSDQRSRSQMKTFDSKPVLCEQQASDSVQPKQFAVAASCSSCVAVAPQDVQEEVLATTTITNANSNASASDLIDLGAAPASWCPSSSCPSSSSLSLSRSYVSTDD